MATNPPDITDVQDTSWLAGFLGGAYGLPKKKWDQLDLNRTAKKLTNVAGVEHLHTGFNWQRGDNHVAYWMPQGITGKRNGGRNATKKYLLVSWYYKHTKDPDLLNHKGVRISFVDVSDMDNIKYRHVLLVEPSTGFDPVFQPILKSDGTSMHAGGIACFGNRLFVADTGNGMREFDLTKIFQVSPDRSKQKCGIIDGKGYAFNYYYIMPQTKRYFLDQGGANFSWVSIDWSDADQPRLFTGNYKKGSYDANSEPTNSWWNLSDSGEIVSGYDLITRGAFYKGIQGGHIIDGKAFFAKSGNDTLIVDGVEKSWATEGCEDLHYSIYSKNLWSLTEFSGTRRVFAVKARDYM